MPLSFPTELYLFSDGVFETRRHQDGEPLDRLVEFLLAPRNGQGRSVAEIRNRTLKHLRREPAARRLFGVESVANWITAGRRPRLAGPLTRWSMWVYDRKSNAGRLDKAWDEAIAKGWTVVSMKDDWNIIFPTTQ